MMCSRYHHLKPCGRETTRREVKVIRKLHSFKAGGVSGFAQPSHKMRVCNEAHLYNGEQGSYHNSQAPPNSLQAEKRYILAGTCRMCPQDNMALSCVCVNQEGEGEGREIFVLVSLPILQILQARTLKPPLFCPPPSPPTSFVSNVEGSATPNTYHPTCQMSILAFSMLC